MNNKKQLDTLKKAIWWEQQKQLRELSEFEHNLKKKFLIEQHQRWVQRMKLKQELRLRLRK